MRSVLAGMISGLALSALVLGAASVLIDLSDRAMRRASAPETGAVTVPPGSGFDTVREDREATLPRSEGSAPIAPAPRVTAPVLDTTAPLARGDTAPVLAPSIGGATLPAAPAAPLADTGAIALGRDSPVTSVPSAPMLERPDSEAPISVATTSPPLDPPRPSGALTRNAVEVAVPPDRPVMAVVLVDDGTDKRGPEAIADFPYPLSIAIPAAHPDAADLAARYREAGNEVLILADLPADATPAEIEAAVADGRMAMPQAVAVIEGAGGRAAARDQMASLLAMSGHGLVLRPEGRDATWTNAVPAASVFREIDAPGQTAADMRRALDEAAQRAMQDAEGVIVLGRLRAATLVALRLWRGEDRVALVPVSMVLQQRR